MSKPDSAAASSGKAYIVTGPTSGIGRATALELAKHGTVVLVGTPEHAARVITNILTDESVRTGVYHDEKGQPMLGSERVRDPKFQDRVVAETRALLAKVIEQRGGN